MEKFSEWVGAQLIKTKMTWQTQGGNVCSCRAMPAVNTLIELGARAQIVNAKQHTNIHKTATTAVMRNLHIKGLQMPNCKCQ